MDPLFQLKDRFEELTKAEQKLARYLLDHPQCLLNDPLNDIAQKAGSSNAAMVRLCQKLGYKGFSEFKFSMRRSLLSSPMEKGDIEHQDPYQDILNTYISYINQLPAFVDKAELHTAAQTICSANRIAIWGANRTALSAQMLSHRLRRMGIFNEMSSDWVVMRDDTYILGEGDCYILFTMKGGGIRPFNDYITDLAGKGCHIILVTMDPKIAVVREADQVIVLPCPSQDTSPNFLEDQIVVFLFIELLLYEVSKCYQE